MLSSRGRPTKASVRSRRSVTSRVHEAREPIGRDDVVLAPGLIALGKRRRSWQQLVELAVSRLEHVLGSSSRADAVTALDFVLEGDLLAGQAAGDRLQPHELRVQPAGLARLSKLRRLRGELGGRLELLGLHLLRQLGRAVVGVHEPVDVAAQPQA